MMPSNHCDRLNSCKFRSWCAIDYHPELYNWECYEVETNIDRVRGYTDEELADAFAAACPPTKGANRCCEYYSAGTDGCHACWLDWLRSPVGD